MKTIVAAVDFSNATSAVMEISINLAKACGADLQLFHVIAPEPGFVTYGFTQMEYPMMDTLIQEKKNRATELMKTLLTKTKEQIPRATSVIAEGSPIPGLLDHVKRSGADFVVVGSHGHGMIGALLLGSVAEGMVRKASVPTLIVPVTPE
jgi:nucleotide-binding universal stress UspA family protein